MIHYTVLADYLGKLTESRAKNLAYLIHTAIKDSSKLVPVAEDLTIGPLARRLYAYSLRKAGDPVFDVRIDAHGEEVSDSNTRLPSPQWKEVANHLNAFAETIKPKVFDPLTPKDVEHFCTLKVRGSTRNGFYLLVALFLLAKEEAGEFEGKVYAPHIPASENRLGSQIASYVARNCNEEAGRQQESLPFDIKPARPVSANPEVQFRYVFDPQFADRCRELVEDYQSPIDGNAHFVVYRSRQSKPAELMKSFLVIKPFKQSTGSERLHYQRTLHIYQAPEERGGAHRAAPGQVVPLASGLFILGGQHAEAMRSKDAPRREDHPFRSVELIFLPWSALESSHLFSGLMFASNNRGEPLVCRICVRPTLVAKADQASLGAFKLEDLQQSVEADELNERAHAGEIKRNDDVDRFFRVYEEFGGLRSLAGRIADACNNHPLHWDIPPGLVDAERKLLKLGDARMRIDKVFEDLQAISGDTFEFWNHIRFAPLVSN